MSSALGAVMFLTVLASDECCLAHLDKQLAWHREYGLPRVPPQASLVWYVTEPTTHYLDGGRKKVVEPGVPGLGFSLDGRTVLDSANRSESVAALTFVKPDPGLVRAGVFVDWRQFAVACHERGWKALALVALRKSVRADGWTTENQVARTAWDHWVARIHHDPGTPLPALARYLNRALLGTKGGKADRALARSVELAARPRTAPPGSAESLIDELVDLGGVSPGPFRKGVSLRSDPRYQALARLGLAIVPALIAHLDDQRITRALGPLINTGLGLKDGDNLRVRDVVLDLLEQLHGGPFALREGTLDERLRVIGNWFSDAHKLGEEKYVVARILGEDATDDRFRPALFELLTEKYPEHLPAVFRKLIDTRRRQHRYASWYARAIAEAPIPREQKQKILEYAAVQDVPALRAAGIHHLRPLDPKLAKGLLLHGLANLGTEPGFAEAELAGIVAEGTDRDEWSALGLAVRRAEVGARIRLLGEVSREQSPAAQRHRLAFLAEYLTDDEVRHDRYNFEFERLEVRNFVATQLADILSISAEPKSDWTPAQWADLRVQIRTAVAKELQR
jgi:hypothetical protein